MTEKFGIVNIKAVLLFGIVMGMRLEQVTAEDSQKGSRVTWTEAMGSLPALKHAPDAIKAIPQLKNEFNDLSADELDELGVFLKDELDLANNVVEKAIEAGWVWLEATHNLIRVFVAKKDTDIV